MGVFDPNYVGNVLTAYDINNIMLEKLTSGVDGEFPVGNPGGSFSTFIGFCRDTSDIAWLELTHVPGDWLGIDNVTFYGRTNPVPEPSTMLLLGFGAVGLAGITRKKMKK